MKNCPYSVHVSFGVDREERANQNNHMMAECILSSLTPECQLKLTQYEKEYTIGGTICAALLFKVLMRMSTMDSVATIKSESKKKDELVAM